MLKVDLEIPEEGVVSMFALNNITADLKKKKKRQN